ncbi:MmyB family transcriptional regulator [Herbiconiux liangxiaofengii]|uniref:MmyB family transcriptional regulator n=1 Tax=Herbiconiux liangxiaofengii TaxID=3342795 RepID=UPI0035BA3C4A
MEHDELSMHAHRARTREQMQTWTHLGAVLVDRHLQVLASNALARALSPGFQEGMNLARYTFLSSEVPRDRDCWDAAAAQVAGMLRESIDQHAVDQSFVGIVGELAATSQEFSDAWAEESIPSKLAGELSFLDTAIGTVSLGYTVTRAPERFDDLLIICRPLTEAARADVDRLVRATTT